MLICDSAIREEGSGKVSLIGIFANINGTSFPLVHPALTVYVNITDAEGQYKFRLDLNRVGDAKLLGRAEMDAEIADRTRPAEILFQITPLLFEKPGVYEFQFYANGLHVGGKSFEVVKLAVPPGEAS
jgi:hypothetical protein